MNRLNTARTHLIGVLAAACAAKPAVATGDPPSPRRSFQFAVPIERNDHVDKSRNGSGIYERKELPPELFGPNVVKLTRHSSAEGGDSDGECIVYLVGIAHRKPEYYPQIAGVIEFLKPEVVFLELCGERRDMIHSEAGEADEEFVVAANEARIHGATILLGDRPISITEARLEAKICLWHLLFPFPKLWQTYKLSNVVVKGPRNTLDDMMNIIIQEYNRVFPNFMEVLVHERDKYMSSLLLAVQHEHNSVVAIVGKAHLPGIRNNWEQPIDVEQLIETPAISQMRRHIAKAIISYLHDFYDKIKP